MRKLSLFILVLLLSNLSYGQIIKIQGGTSISTIDWKLNNFGTSSLYESSLTGYSLFVGIDYLDENFINLTSNLGILRKGGKQELELTTPTGEFTGETNVEKPKLDYLSFNTLIEFKYNIKNIISPLLSFGPRIDYLIDNSEHFESLNEMDELEKYSYGLLLGGGIKHDISKIQIGLRIDYYLNFNKIADWKNDNSSITGGEISDDTFTINLTVGYKLK